MFIGKKNFINSRVQTLKIPRHPKSSILIEMKPLQATGRKRMYRALIGGLNS